MAVIAQDPATAEEENHGGQAVGTAGRDAVDHLLHSPRIDRFQGPIVGVQPAGVVFRQGPVQQHLDQDMSEKTGPKTAIGGQHATDRGGKLEGGLGEGPGIVELGIVAEMLREPPPGRPPPLRDGVGGQRLHVFGLHADTAIDNGEPIGHGRSCHEVGVGEERQGVGEVIHCTNLHFSLLFAIIRSCGRQRRGTPMLPRETFLHIFLRGEVP